MDDENDLHARLLLLRTLESLVEDYRTAKSDKVFGALKAASAVRNSIRDEFLLNRRLESKHG